MPNKNLTLGLCALLASTALARGNEYKVRNGDFDWAIAKRHEITVGQLHRLNPGVDWDALRIGLTIRVPDGHASASVASARTGRHTGASHFYKVHDGDNDWIIAHRAGTTVPVLKSLNPDVKLALLHPGEKIRLPGSIDQESAPIHRIHSTRVAIGGDNVTIRRGPGTDHDSICAVDGGLQAAVLDRHGSWYQLRFPKGTVGWVRGDFLKAVHVVLRRERSHHSYLAVRRRHSHRSGGEHYATSSYVAADTAINPTDDPLLRRAESMRGIRYRWGEASRSGTDCSGFTSQVFRSEGVHLPRTSREQAHVGQKVRYKDLKAGDLVFFHTMRGHRVTHVGIYMGHGKFIHASSAGGHVQVNSLSGYYAHRLVAARRVSEPSSK